jgi:hypothetical protein
MLKGRTFLWVILLAVVAALAGGLLHLLQLRFAAGDVYPAYSSLRSDPLGTKALYESLGALRGVTVERNYDVSSLPGEGRDSTLVVAGLATAWTQQAPPADYEMIERFAAEGGRVVILFDPEMAKSFSMTLQQARAQQRKAQLQREEAKRKAEGRKEPEPRNEARDRVRERMEPVAMNERWKVTVDYDNLRRNERGFYEPVTVRRTAPIPELPESLTFHTAVHFGTNVAHWRVIYERGGKAVLIEKAHGAGTIVLAADSWHLSNEALRVDRQSALLAWLVGPARRVVFDETHLGVAAQPGVASLARKYRLHGLFLGLLLLAGLFVWKNASTLVPPAEDVAIEGSAAVVAGRDATSGFVNLLRRSIPAGEVLRVCLGEWEKSCLRGRPALEQKAARMRQLVEEDAALDWRDRQPVETYRRVCELLKLRS